MKTLLGRLFYLAAGVSAMLLLASLVMWPVSYRCVASARYESKGSSGFGIGGDDGRLEIGMFQDPRTSLHVPDPERRSKGISFFDSGKHTDKDWMNWSYLSWRKTIGTSSRGWSAISFGVTSSCYNDGKFEAVSIWLPFSYIAVLLSVFPALAFRATCRRKKTARLGLCRLCGYDLRSHSAGERCPECGTVIELCCHPV